VWPGRSSRPPTADSILKRCAYATLTSIVLVGLGTAATSQDAKAQGLPPYMAPIAGRTTATPADTATKDMLNTVLKSGEHLYTLINQVLDVSKIEAGAATLAETNLDLYTLLDELAEMFSLMAKQKDLRLIVESKPDVPKHVRVDAVKLRQVLINLLSNAFKFTRAGSIWLQVEKRRSIHDAECLLLFKVIDTGVGRGTR